jgi:RNA polymerase sigma-70 factor (ECF subfamily)
MGDSRSKEHDELLAAFAKGAGKAHAGDVALAEQLRNMVAQASEKWPKLKLHPAGFVAHLAKLLPKSADPVAALEPLWAGDLYLAFGCLCHHEAAVAEVRSRLEPRELSRRGVRLGSLEKYLEEAQPQILDQVFVGGVGQVPEISRYSGRGRLDAWLATVAVHAALKVKRSATRHASGDTSSDGIADLSSGVDVERGYIKARYRDDFNAAFREALGSLSSRDKAVLRLSVVQQLGIDAIGAMFKVHRATAARWLVRVRAELADRTREELARRLGARLQSQVDVSVSRALETEEH